MKTVFISGGTGYIGKRLTKRLLQKGHKVIVLAREGSEHKVITEAEAIVADPFGAGSFQKYIPKEAVYVQLLGVSHPSPKKAKQFHEIDLRSVKASADAAENAGIAHFVYVSVAMSPSKFMHEYQAVRSEGEKYCSGKTFNCSFIRPWYVLGPGHWWPILLLPFYGLAELVPSWRKQAREKSLVTIGQMLNTLINVIEDEPSPLRIYEIKDIRHSPINKIEELKTTHQKPSYL